MWNQTTASAATPRRQSTVGTLTRPDMRDLPAAVLRWPQLIGFFGELEGDGGGVDDARHRGGGAPDLHRARLVVDAAGYGLDVPHQAESGHGADCVPGEIVFPPVEAVARRALK